MNSKKILEILEKNFNIHYSFKYEDEIEIETTTDEGVNMIHILDNDNLKNDFISLVDDFDIDEEIDSHRQEELYREVFSIRDSLEDFECYHRWLKGIKKQIIEV